VVVLLEVEQWSVNLEQGDRWWYAHVAELPGCFTRGETRKEVLEALPQEISHYLGFLETKRKIFAKSTVDFRVVEEIHGIPELGEAGGAVALFTSDKSPVSEGEFKAFLDLMQWNREELLALVNPLPEKALNARPFPDKWTIIETLRHIANAEEWYISRLGPTAQKEYESFINNSQSKHEAHAVVERLATTRHGAIHALRASFSRGVPDTFKRAEYTKYPEEQWTFRKVLRRFVEHEREHIGTIKRVVGALAEGE